jgi:hypothetical protein
LLHRLAPLLEFIIIIIIIVMAISILFFLFFTLYFPHADSIISYCFLQFFCSLQVGLAEHSPDMPLKVLHGMLVDPVISIVGLSNWVLDPAKMNRAICLHRTEPTAEDIQQTGQRIVDASKTSQAEVKSALDKWLGPLAQAYHDLYTQQSSFGRDFFGMRDYYSLIKLLRQIAAARKALGKDIFTPALLMNAVSRNFGGSANLTEFATKMFYRKCFDADPKDLHLPSVRELIRENLKDKTSRHLMVITTNGSALPILFGSKLLSTRKTSVLIGSEFKDDISELHLVQQINEVKLAMASGSTIVLLNHDNIYEALYDVLNQRYVFKTDPKTGVTRKMLRLAIGARSQLCYVDDAFKIVVVVEQDHAYNDLDLPLLNRFEKQVLTPDVVLGHNQSNVVRGLEAWIANIVTETGLQQLTEVFCGYEGTSTVASVVLTLSEYSDSYPLLNTPQFAEACRQQLTRVAMPLAVLHSDSLQSVSGVDYSQSHLNMLTAFEKYVLQPVQPLLPLGAQDPNATSFYVLLTQSPVSHLDMSLDHVTKAHPQVKTTIIQLAELSSERHLRDRMADFLGTRDSQSSGVQMDVSALNACDVLVIQCDPVACRASLINHARFICNQEDEKARQVSGMRIRNRKVIMFAVHLPPGISQRRRWFGVDFRAPWQYIFIDDLRVDAASARLGMLHLLQNSPYTLTAEQIVSIKQVLISKFQSSLCACFIPRVDSADAQAGASTSLRIRMLRDLLATDAFLQLSINAVETVLSRHTEVDKTGMHAHVAIIRQGGQTGSLGQFFLSPLSVDSRSCIILFSRRT